MWQLGIESGGPRARQVDADQVDTGTRQHAHARHPFSQRFRSDHEQLIQSRVEMAQELGIEPARKVDVSDRALAAGGGDAALGQRSFARAPWPGQQAQPADRPPADARQRIEFRDPGGPDRTRRGRRARRGAPEAGLEHRNGLLETIWHLSSPKGEMTTTAVTSGLPGGRRSRSLRLVRYYRTNVRASSATRQLSSIGR